MSNLKIAILVAQLVRGFISGTVTDATDAAVPGVQIRITNNATNISRDTFTNDAGFYRLVAIEPGVYSVEFSLTGFETRKLENVEVGTAHETVINQVLHPAGVSAEVTVVAASGAELQKTIATIERDFSATVIQELPLPFFDGARDITRLALLAPTVNRAPGSNEFAANGQRARNNNFTVDGVDNNDLSVATSSAGIIPEAVEEVQVQTTSYSAEFGRTVGAQFSAITKSGTNSYHGQGWDYYSGNWLEPLSLTNKRAGLHATPRFVTNDFGGSTGGPIIQDRTFFFGLLSGNLRREAASAGNATSVNIPTPAGYAALSNVPLGAGQIPGSRQAALSALSFLPDVYSQVSNYDNLRNVAINGTPIPIGTIVIPLPQPLTYFYSAGRIDHRATSKDNLTYRFHIDKRDEPNTTSNLGFGTRFTAAAKILRQNHAVSYTRSLSPRFLNEARVAYVRSFLNFQENDPKTSTVTISGFFTIGGTSAFPQGRVEQLYEWQDVASYLAGRNSLRFGGDVRRNKLFGRFGTNSKGTWAFSGLAEFLNSTPSALSEAINEATFNISQWHQSYFFQDDIKASKDLTINAGMRYEYATVPAGFFGATDPAVRAVGVPGPAQPDKNNFAPRVGFAYSPSEPKGRFAGVFGNGKTSMRGGFGMSYDVLFYNIVANAASNYPRVVTQILSGAPIANTYPTLAPKVAIVPPLNPLNTFTNTPEHIQNPTVNFWSLSLQRELGSNYVLELGYTGNRSYHELRQSQANPGVLTPAQAATVIASGSPNSVTVQRLNPAWGARSRLETSAKSAYNAGYLKFDRRFSKGLVAGLNYTWSTMLSDNDEAFNVSDIAPWSSQLPQDFFNLRKEWSRSVFDRPHRFVVHYLYEMRWLGGWQVSGFTEYQSGQPFTITTGLDSVGTLVTGSFPGRPNYNPRGVFTHDPVTHDLRTFQTAIDGTGIIVAPLGRNGLLANSMPGGGNLGRNTFRGPSFQNWNISLGKRIRIREGLELQFRSDFVNAWNHNNFAPPEARMTSPAFGSNNATPVTDTRDILLSAKVRF